MRLRIASIAFFFFSAFTFTVLICGARAQNSSTPPAQTPKTAGQQFRNLQVLKDIPADQFIPAMQFISNSLGVECEYCHVERAFEKDDKKPKITARKMMEMMMSINRENFEGHREVTCFSCHHGVSKPIAIPIISAEPRRPETISTEAKPPATLPKPEDLLDKFLAAVGGPEALQKISTRVQKGTIAVFGGQKFPIEIYAKAPGMRVSVTHLKQGESVTAFNGKTGWLQTAGRVHFMNPQEISEARIDADMTFAADVRRMYQKFETALGRQIDGHDTWLVIGLNEGRPPLNLYFDQASGLLLRMERYIDSPLGYNPTQIDYADYRDADGVKIPFRWTIARPNGRFTIEISELQQNVPVDDAKFTPPPPTPSN